MTLQLKTFGEATTRLYSCQQKIESANIYTENFIHAISASKAILSFSPPKTEPTADQTIKLESQDGLPVSEPIQQPASQNLKSDKSTLSVSKGPSQKRQRSGSIGKDAMFSLERERESLPRKLRTPDNVEKLETILRFIAGRKKDGAVLRDIVTLLKDSTLHCNEYLGALVKIEEIERKQRKNEFVYTLHSNRYYKYLNS